MKKTLMMACCGLAVLAAAQDVPSAQVELKPGVPVPSPPGEAASAVRLRTGAAPLAKPAEAAKRGVWLGIVAMPVPEMMGKQLKLDDGQGLLVEFIAPGSPAEHVLEVHDILIEFDGKSLTTQSQLRQIIKTHKAGDEVSVLVCRAGERKTLKVKLGDAPDGILAAASSDEDPVGLDTLHVELADPRRQGRLGMEPQGETFAVASSVVESRDGYSYIMRFSRTSEAGMDRSFLVRSLKSGKIEFSGPVNSDEEKAKVPEAYRPAMERMLKNTVDFKLPKVVEIPPMLKAGGDLPMARLEQLMIAQERRMEEQRRRMEEVTRRMEQQMRDLEKEVQRLRHLQEGQGPGPDDEAEGADAKPAKPPPHR